MRLAANGWGHISAIFLKLEVRDRDGDIIRAYDAGIVAPGQRRI